MKLFGKDLSTEIVVVAEIGVNHEGSAEKAMQMVGLAADAKVDAVKFQTYDPYRYATTSNMERFERVSRFALSSEDFTLLAKEAERREIGFFSTPLDESSVELVASLSPVIKIASPDLTFEPTPFGPPLVPASLLSSQLDWGSRKRSIAPCSGFRMR